MNENNVAYQMSLRSRECLKTKDKARWLDMWAEDGIIEDPIGPTVLDPDGKGHSTPEAREAFYDRNIANADIEYIIHQTYTAHLEWFHQWLGGNEPPWSVEDFANNAVFDPESGERREP